MSLLDRLRGKDDRTEVTLTLRGGQERVATRVPGLLAWEEWQRRRSQAEGEWPLLITAPPPQVNPKGLRPSHVIEKADLGRVERAFARQLEEMELENGERWELGFDAGSLELRAPREPEFQFAQQDPVWVVQIPCREGWQVPAHLPFGDWNYCLPDEAHCALLRDWHERYGAELVSMSGKSLELWIARPIADRDEAKRVALQHLAYCDVLSREGAPTARALAQDLMGARAWFFWWD